MDALCLKAAGIHAFASFPIAASGNGEIRLASAAAPPTTLRWGFTFRHPLGSLWPGGKNGFESSKAVDDAALTEERDDLAECGEEDGQNENWVFKILNARSLSRKEKDRDLVEELGVNLVEDLKSGDERDGTCGGVNEECDACSVEDDEKIQFTRESFCKMLRKVPLSEARLYARMSYLGSLAYSIPQIKPGKLLKNHGLRFLTSSLEKKEKSMKDENEKAAAEGKQEQGKTAAENQVNEETQLDGREPKPKANHARAYQIAASAASYLHYHTKSFLGLNSSKSGISGKEAEKIDGSMVSVDMINQDMASLIATTDSVTSVVAAKEEVKQAVADDLNSPHSWPCEWFVCDDEQNTTRYFVIQGSESLASWQANLLFEPISFEGHDVFVHRGIYEAAKGIYEQMLPEIQDHLKSHGDRATFRFIGHSLGGSLSLLLNLMLLIRGEAPRSSLLPVITFGAPSIMCGGDRLLHSLGLPRNHIRSINMHRDIVPRAFSCNYPGHVAKFLKAVNWKFRSLPCLNKRKLLYAPMGEFFILQPDDKFSPNHDLLPSGSGLYLLTCPLPDVAKAQKQIIAAQAVFLNSPHPLEILSDRGAYGSQGTIFRDHDMGSYLKSVRHVVHQELKRMRKAKRERRRKVWWPLVTQQAFNAGIIISTSMTASVKFMGGVQSSLSGIVQTSRESQKRFSGYFASGLMRLLVVLMFPARLLMIGTHRLVNLY